MTSLSGGYLILKTLGLTGIQLKNSHSFFSYYHLLKQIPNGLLKGALKSFSLFYMVLLGPVLEEWLFRDQIYAFQQQQAETSRTYRILTNAAIFGAFHFNIFSGFASLTYVAVATFSGIIFASLREKSGSLYAPIIAHSINNAVVLLFSF